MSIAVSIGYSIKQVGDGGYIIAGSTGPNNNYQDLYLIKTDSDGNEEWNTIYGGSSQDLAYSVQPVQDGGYIITGYTTSFGNGNYDVWLI